MEADLLDLSIICPVFNSDPGLLRDAVASVLDQQGGTALELILVDDASTSVETLRMLQALQDGDPRIRLVRQARNAGPASARNRGLKLAKGSWIGFLDSDDLWLPGRIASLAPLMGRQDMRWIGSRHRFLMPDGRSDPAPWLMEQPKAAAGGPALTRHLIANFWLHLGAILVRRDLALQAGGFAEGLFYYEDFLFLTKLSVLAPLHPLDAEVYAWRRAGGGLTGSPARLGAAALRMHKLAAADPLLHGFRRELRWARYSACKGLALNNLLAGRGGSALRFALRAWRADPREVGDLVMFLRLWAGGPQRIAQQGDRYSLVERFAIGGGHG